MAKRKANRKQSRKAVTSAGKRLIQRLTSAAKATINPAHHTKPKILTGFGAPHGDGYGNRRKPLSPEEQVEVEKQRALEQQANALLRASEEAERIEAEAT